MSVGDTILGGGLALAGAAAVAVFELRARRAERLQAWRDDRDAEVLDGASQADLVLKNADPEVLPLFGSDEYFILRAGELAEHGREASRVLLRVATGHPSQKLRDLARSASDAFVQAVSSVLFTAEVLRSKQGGDPKMEKAKHQRAEAETAVAALRKQFTAERALLK